MKNKLIPKGLIGIIAKLAKELKESKKLINAVRKSKIIRTIDPSGKIKLSLPSHTSAKPRQFVLEPQGNNKFYVHMRIWDDVDKKIPGVISNEEKLKLFEALYEELPEGAEILFPQSGPDYYATRGTIAGLLRLSRDSRFAPGTKGSLQYIDKDGTIKTFEGTSFVKKDIPSMHTNNPDENLVLATDYKHDNYENLKKIFYNFNLLKGKTTIQRPVDKKNIDLTSKIFIDPNKRFMFFEPSKFINYDIGEMSVEDVVKTFGPEAEYYKSLYDVAKAHNFEGKYAKIAEDAKYNILNRFAISKSDPDVAKGLAEARGIYDIPEYRARFNRWGTLGDTFIDDAVARIDNVRLQGRSNNLPIIGKNKVTGGAYTRPDPMSPIIGIHNYDNSKYIQEFITHEANHASHGTIFQPKWMELHNSKLKLVPRNESNDGVSLLSKEEIENLNKYYQDMDEVVERSKTAVEYANKIRKDGESLDSALERVADMADANEYDATIPSDIRQMMSTFTKESTLNFWKNFVGGLTVPLGIGVASQKKKQGGKLIPKGQGGLLLKLIEKFPKTAEELTKLIKELKKIKPSEWTVAQDAAIARGDMVEAQRLRDLHFKVSAPNTFVLDNSGNPLHTFHGGAPNIKSFNILRPRLSPQTHTKTYGAYFTPNKQFATIYENTENQNVMYDTYLNLDKMADMGDASMIDEATYNSLIPRFNGVYGKNFDEYVSFNPNRIKLADAVTYDNNGVRIPLGERDNFDVNDVSYGYPSSQLTGTTIEEIQNFIDNDIIPRVQAQGHQITEYKPNIRVADFENDLFDQKLKNENAGAWFSLATNEITLRSPLKNLNFGLVAHEAGGHGLRYNMLTYYSPVPRRYVIEYLKNPNNPKVQEILSNANIGNEVFNDYELKLLNEGYPEISNYFNNFVNPLTGLKLSEVQKLERIQKEQGAVNTQFRAELSEHGKLTGVLLDKKIDKIPEGEILRMKIEHSYTQNGTIDIVSKITGVNPDNLMFYNPESLLELVNKFPELKSIVNKTKQAMKTVGIYAVPVGLGIGVSQKENKNNKLIPKQNKQ